jgi:hypothetical protein
MPLSSSTQFDSTRHLAFENLVPVTSRCNAAAESLLVVRRALLLLFCVAGAMTVAATAGAQGDVSIEISRHAQLASDGSITYTVRVTCGPLPGTEDFTEGLAGASQERTGAEAEGGLSPDVVCDGAERVYTAGISVITEAVFKRGPAVASVGVIACNTVGDGQVCVQASAQRRIIVSGRATGT